MGELKHIIKLNDEQLETLMTAGSVTVDEVTVELDLYGLYLTADEDRYVLYSPAGTVTVATPSAGTDAVNLDYINAVKSELQAQLVGKVDYLGLLNDFNQLATTNATAGDYFINNMTELYLNGTWAAKGDVIIAKVDNPTSSDDWDVVPDKFDLDTFIRPLLLWQPSTNVFRISYESNGLIDLPLKGSEGIIVDVAEDNKAIEIHFEDTFLTNVNKAARALVTPISAPAEKSIVAVGTNNAQTMMTLTELKNELGSGSSSGGIQVYTYDEAKELGIDTNKIIAVDVAFKPISDESGGFTGVATIKHIPANVDDNGYIAETIFDGYNEWFQIFAQCNFNGASIGSIVVTMILASSTSAVSTCNADILRVYVKE